MLINLDKAPFPWFGGKSQAAPMVWERLGDVAHYVEPFFGSGAVLLQRPHLANRPYYSETVNDLDGFVCNFWRAITHDPVAVADAASWPVSEADLSARELAILAWIADGAADRLAGSHDYYDAVVAGWWAWGISCYIGAGFASGDGPWIRDPDDGRLVKQARPGTREPGVSRKLPHVNDNGHGVNHPGTREPGVARQLPHVSDNGQGVNRPGTREPGVARQRPHVSHNGQGVNHAGTREPGVSRQLPHLGDDGRGVNRPATRQPGVGDYHPRTMPELERWFAYLAARLRHVRVLNGDWTRATTSGVLKTLSVRTGTTDVCGVFLDPPYAHRERTGKLYRIDQDVAADVRAWCLANGNDPKLRIVLAGYADEGHEELERAGWTAVEWFAAGFLRGGMGNLSKDGHQQARERLWCSPHCLTPLSMSRAATIAMFDEDAQP
jgi:hypothetical protein